MTIPPEPLVLRDRVRHALAGQAQPMTAAQLAAQLLPAGLESALRQTGRALAQLEAEGAAIRIPRTSRGGGRRPGGWTAAQPGSRSR